MTDMWGDLVWAALADLKTRLMLVLPGILAMLTLAAVGLAGAWVSARVARRLAQAVARTVERRPDVLASAQLAPEARRALNEFLAARAAASQDRGD